jgi:GWxTD domain-containing protein
MRLRTQLAAFAVAACALSAYALSAEYLDWGRGPAQYLMTKDEAAKWKTISSDEDAKEFVILFWARRDPTPDTPRNEFREEYERRVATADKNFVSDKSRGALTERGKMLVLFGMPKKIERAGNQRQGAMPGMSGGLGSGRAPTGTPQESTATTNTTAMDDFTAGGATSDDEGQVWTYEGDAARATFGQVRSQLRFVDKDGKGNFILQRGGVDIAAGQRKTIEKSIVRPNLTMADLAAAPAGMPEAAPIADVGVAPQTELTTESLKAAVAEMKAATKNPYENKAFATWGEYVTAEGEYFVPVQVYVPKSAGLNASQDLTFFGVVQDENGNNIRAFEEPVKLTVTKDDFFVDRSLTGIPAGKYRGVFGLAENGKPVSMVAADMTLAGSLDKDAPGVSPLILSNNVYALPQAQHADDPHAFGGLKVVPKSDRTFRPTDDLWYFVELRNPGVPESMTVPVEGAPAAAAPAALPKIQVKIDVDGVETGGKKIRRPAPPREIEAIEIKGVPGHYGIGNAIPLASFKPGEYTFNMKVIDTIRKTSYTVSEKFTVVE